MTVPPGGTQPANSKHCCMLLICTDEKETILEEIYILKIHQSGHFHSSLITVVSARSCRFWNFSTRHGLPQSLRPPAHNQILYNTGLDSGNLHEHLTGPDEIPAGIPFSRIPRGRPSTCAGFAVILYTASSMEKIFLSRT